MSDFSEPYVSQIVEDEEGYDKWLEGKMRGDLTKEQGLDKLLVEGKEMTEEELEKEIAAEIRQAIQYCLDVKKSVSKSCHDCSSRIITLIREAGYKSKKEVEKIKAEDCDPELYLDNETYGKDSQ